MLFASAFPLGDVASSPFTFKSDGVAFEAVRFPAEQGLSWKTKLGSADVFATVLHRDEKVAHIEYSILANETIVRLNATYGLDERFFRSFEQPNGMRLQLVGSGHGGVCRTWSPGEVLHYPMQPYALYRGWGRWDFDVPVNVTDVYLRVGLRTWGEGLYGLQVESPTGVYSDPFKLAVVKGKTYVVEQSPSDPAGTRFTYFVHNEEADGDSRGTWLVRTHATKSVYTGGMTHWMQAFSLGSELREKVPCGRDALAAAELPVAPGEDPPVRLAAWIGLGAGLLAFLLLRRRGLVWLLLGRVTRDTLLEHGTRRRLLEAIRLNPGITTRELSVSLEIPWTTTTHHLRMLLQADVIVGEREGRSRHWFDTSQAMLAPQRTVATVVSRPAARRIFDFVRDHPGMGLTEIARALGVEHTTVRFHLRRLESAGAVQRVPVGRRFRYVPSSGP